MGYGSRALQLLKQYYEMKIPNINENVVQEPVMEIINVPDGAVDLLKENIGNLPFLLLKRYNFLKRYLHIQC